VHGIPDAGQVPHVTDVELDLVIMVELAHIILLLLIPGEYAYLPDIGIQEPPQDSVAEGTGTAGDKKGLVFEHNKSLPS